MAAKKKTSAKKASGGRFAFAPFQIHDRFNVESLSDSLKAQLASVGKKFHETSDVLAIFEAAGEEDMFWEHSLVTERGEPRFDVWVVGAMNGTLFEAGTTKESGLVMIEGKFVAQKSALGDLCPELREGYIAARGSFDAYMQMYEKYWQDFRKKEKAASRKK